MNQNIQTDNAKAWSVPKNNINLKYMSCEFY